MTFNILTDKRSEFPWRMRQEMLLTTVNNQNPDILCVQEASQSQKEYLANHLSEYQVYGVGRNNGKTDGEQTAIFHKYSSLSQIDCGVFWLSATPDIVGSIGWDANRPRTVTWKLLRNAYNQYFYVLNTHYDNIGIEANINSANVINTKLTTINSGYPVILCGDFNSSEDTAAYQRILDIGFTNTRKEAAMIQGLPFTYHMFKMDIFDDKAIVKKLMEGHNRAFKCIDHIFVSGTFIVSNCRVINDVYSGLYPSDHFPVMCDLEFNLSVADTYSAL